MRIPSWAAIAALTLATLTGCAPTVSRYTPAPEPSSTPLFATDEEALAAAAAAYAKYTEVSYQILAEGGARPERIRSVATGEQLETDLKSISDASEKGYRSIGSPTFDSVKLQQHYQTGANEAVVVVYLCQDVSGVQLVDKAGASQVRPTRPDRSKFEVVFETDAANGSGLLVERKELWSPQPC